MSNSILKRINNCLRLGLGAIPQSCVLCAALGCRDGLCRACNSSLTTIAYTHCPRCALPTDGNLCGACLKTPPEFDSVTAAFIYAFPTDALIQSLKYHANLAITCVLAEKLIEAAPGSVGADFFLPVPLAREKQRERGFNQAHEIAKILGRYYGVPVEANLCGRVRNTFSQTSLPWSERTKNIRGAFSCTHDLTGKKIILVDDVLTTGATLNELAKTLRKQGAAEIRAWVVVRTLPM